MNKSFIYILTIVCVLGYSVIAIAGSGPQVNITSVTISQSGSGVVDIYYNLTADSDYTVSVHISDDGGAVPAVFFSGDVGSVSPGPGKHITWQSCKDLPGVNGDNYKLKVIADDGVVDDPAGMVWVSINDDGTGMKDELGNPISHGGFTGQMSKYKTTNAQYCQFLNAAKASNDITVSGSYVMGTSGPYSGQNYYYLAGPGYTINGATNGGAARINWNGSSFTVDSGFENHPVTYVSWYGSTAFASYYGWRLPTEWEWQAVADYNGSYTYGCGTTINNSIANYYGSTHPDGTTVVGAFGTYGYGMCDMAGNVWEWTSSLWDPGYSYRVVRGGGWKDHGSYCVVSIRSPDGSTSDDGGFRTCR